MSHAASPAGWVVYRMNIRGKLCGTNAVCEQAEWDAMERARPGFHTLIKAGIANEGEAEQYARTTPVIVQPVSDAVAAAPA